MSDSDMTYLNVHKTDDNDWYDVLNQHKNVAIHQQLHESQMFVQAEGLRDVGDCHVANRSSVDATIAVFLAATEADMHGININQS